MAQTGYTPLFIYSSTTAAAAPSTGNLTNGTLGSELAVNITDGKLFYKDNANAIQVLAWKITPTTAGGTGLTSYTAGDLVYYSTGTTLSKLAIGTAYYQLGVNAGGTAPSYQPSPTSVLTAQGDLLYASAANTLARLAKNTTATRYLANTGSSNNPAWAQIDVSNGITGTVPVGNGGTGQTAWTANGILYASGTSTLANGTTWTFDGTNVGLGTTISTAWGGVGSAMQIGSYISLNSNSNLGAGDLSYNSIRTASDSYQYLATNNATRFQQRDGAFKWFTAPSGTAGTAITFTQSMLLDASSNLTLNVGNLIPNVAGKGVNFTANTPLAGMTSQLLNWYEDGTYTPTVTAGVGSITSYSATAKYTRIGRQVTVCFEVTISNNGTGATSLIVTLPFTCGSQASIGVGRENGSTGNILQAYVGASASTAIVLTAINTYPGASGYKPTCTVTYFV
jgi:hypothetical protein